MRLLLDTHISLWYISGDPQPLEGYRDAISDPSHEVYLSAASVWEVVIKHGLGKLPLPEPPAVYLPKQRERHQITSLPLDEGALVYLANLPQLHRDSFDRILIAQSIQHGLALVSVDASVLAYPVKTFAAP